MELNWVFRYSATVTVKFGYGYIFTLSYAIPGNSAHDIRLDICFWYMQHNIDTGQQKHKKIFHLARASKMQGRGIFMISLLIMRNINKR